MSNQSLPPALPAHCSMNADLKRQADSSLSKANRATQVGCNATCLPDCLQASCVAIPLSALLRLWLRTCVCCARLSLPHNSPPTV